MTPERKAEIDAMIKWWNQQENIRINGFNIVCNDPLFSKINARRKQAAKD